MKEARRKYFLSFFTLLQISSIVNGSGDTFQRVDNNDESRIAAGFTIIFHECTFDSKCNFVVRTKEESELEKMQNVDDVTKYYSVWKRLKKRQVSNVALNKPVSMSSQYDSTAVASNAVDGNLNTSHENCAITQRKLTSPWLLVDLLSKYAFFTFGSKKETMVITAAPSHLMLELETIIKKVEYQMIFVYNKEAYLLKI